MRGDVSIFTPPRIPLKFFCSYRRLGSNNVVKRRIQIEKDGSNDQDAYQALFISNNSFWFPDTSTIPNQILWFLYSSFIHSHHNLSLNSLIALILDDIARVGRLHHLRSFALNQSRNFQLLLENSSVDEEFSTEGRQLVL